MKLGKVCYISGLRISKVLNAPFVIELAGKYESTLTLNESVLSEFMIEPSADLVGMELAVELESKNYSSGGLGRDDLLIGDIDRLVRVSRVYHKKATKKRWMEYYAAFQTPRSLEDETKGVFPCPFYDIKTDLTGEEYRELVSLPSATVMRFSCMLKEASW